MNKISDNVHCWASFLSFVAWVERSEPQHVQHEGCEQSANLIESCLLGFVPQCQPTVSTGMAGKHLDEYGFVAWVERSEPQQNLT